MSTSAAPPDTAAWALAAIEAFPEALVSLDADRRVLRWNDAAQRLTGFTEASMAGERFDVAVPERLRRRFVNAYERIVRGQPLETPSFDGRLLHATGDVVPVNVTLVPTRRGGEFRLYMLIRDVRGRYEAARQNRQLLSHHELLLRSIDAIVISIDCEARVTKWNRSAEKIFELAEPMALGRRFDQLPLDWPVPRIQSAIAVACAAESARLDDVPFRKPDGTPLVLGLVFRPLVADAHLTGCLITGANITERRSLETQLRRAERLESIGQLAAGIAHEINTPIQFVGDNLRFLADGLQDMEAFQAAGREALEAAGGDRSGKLAALAEELEVDYLQEELPRAIQQSLEGVGRVARIVRAMKELSHPPSEDMSPADLNHALESASIITKNEWKYFSELDLDLDAGLPAVTCRINELSQVFLNLIVNAAHAVSARWGQDTQEGRIRVQTRALGDTVEVRVTDNGTGMSEQVRARCFDPFFTTKGVGRGTGQGLAITHAIVVDHHGGSVDLETEIGVGTTMILRLPVEPTSTPEGSPS